MELPRQLAEGLLDFILGSRSIYPQHFVVVSKLYRHDRLARPTLFLNLSNIIVLSLS